GRVTGTLNPSSLVSSSPTPTMASGISQVAENKFFPERQPARPSESWKLISQSRGHPEIPNRHVFRLLVSLQAIGPWFALLTGEFWTQTARGVGEESAGE